MYELHSNGMCLVSPPNEIYKTKIGTCHGTVTAVKMASSCEDGSRRRCRKGRQTHDVAHVLSMIAESDKSYGDLGS